MKKISRKKFLTTGVSALSGATILGSACVPGTSTSPGSSPNINLGASVQWTMVTTWPPNFPILQEGCVKMADWVEKMSAGRLKIRVYGGGELVPPLEAFENVSNGTAQIGHGAAYYWAGKRPAFQFFASVPFGMNAQQINAWMISGEGLKLWEEAYEPFNVIPFPGGNTGVQMGGWFNKEINSLADLKGLKMRIPGLGGKVFTRAGGTSVNVPGQEIYTNLERGVIDATEWIGPYHDYVMGFHKIAKYYYYPSWQEGGTCLEFFVNKQAFESLSEDLQEIVRIASAGMNTWMLSQFEAKNARYLEKILQEGQIEMRAFPEDVIAQLRKITNEVVQEMLTDESTRKIYDSFRQFKNTVKDWSGYSEKIFYSKLQ